MKYREHRGGLSDSMATMVEVNGLQGLLWHLSKRAETYPSFPVVSEKTVHIEPYGFDDRIGWDTHIVTLDGYGVLGFTDGPAVRTGESRNET